MDENNTVTWILEDTTTPDVNDDQPEQIAMVIGIVIAAAMAITALFVIAVFIDCRQQKVHKERVRKSKRVLKAIIPQLTKNEDQLTIVSRIDEGSETDIPSHVV